MRTLLEARCHASPGAGGTTALCEVRAHNPRRGCWRVPSLHAFVTLSANRELSSILHFASLTENQKGYPFQQLTLRTLPGVHLS